MPVEPRDSSMSKRTTAVTIAAVLLVAAVLVAASLLPQVSSYLTSAIVLVLAMVPAFASFEGRGLDARRLTMLAVMAAIAVASRVAFIWLPGFKPMLAVVMLAGIVFGAQDGFAVGALAMLASNFIFGQGPWTPWQMFAFGVGAFLFGALFHRRSCSGGSWSMKERLAVSTVGALIALCVVGPLLDTCSLFTFISKINLSSAIAIYAAGLPVNAMQALATFVTLFLFGSPLLNIVSRIKQKYALAL